MLNIEKGTICVIIGTSLSQFKHLELANLALRGGARMIQLREKQLPDREIYTLAVAIKALCRQQEAIFIVNNRIDIAKASDADGVHLGQQDIPLPIARAMLGEEKVLGASVGTLKEALDAEKQGANYLGVGHIFFTSSKKKETPPIGLDNLSKICKSVSIPTLGIGGINLESIPRIASCGTSGVAVISAISQSLDPQRVVSDMIKKFSLSA